MNDPMVQAIHKLLDHAAETEDRIERPGRPAAARTAWNAATPRQRPKRSTRSQINKMLE